MKNLRQIKAFLKEAIISNEDRCLIEDFLKQREKFDGTVWLLCNSGTVVRYEDFISWYKAESFRKGDCVVYDGTIGIIQRVKTDTLILGVSLKDDMLIGEKVEVPISKSQKANDDQMIKFQNVLFEYNLVWSNYHNKLIKPCIPEVNDFIRVTRLGIRQGLGIFNEIRDNEIIFFVYLNRNDQLRYSLEENIGKESDFQLERVCPEERLEVLNALDKINKVWNGHFDRLEPKNWRADDNETYYYINTYFEISEDKELSRGKDLRRIRHYNYYRIKENAEQIMKLIASTWNEYYGVLTKNEIENLGKSYYYIDDYLSVNFKKGSKMPKDRKRLGNYNYFLKEDHAQKMVETIIEMRKKQLISTSIG